MFDIGTIYNSIGILAWQLICKGGLPRFKKGMYQWFIDCTTDDNCTVSMTMLRQSIAIAQPSKLEGLGTFIILPNLSIFHYLITWDRRLWKMRKGQQIAPNIDIRICNNLHAILYYIVPPEIWTVFEKRCKPENLVRGNFDQKCGHLESKEWVIRVWKYISKN